MLNEDNVLKIWCETDLLNFARYLYKNNHGRNFTIAPHFTIISNKLMDVISGKIKRLIINVPP